MDDESKVGCFVIVIVALIIAGACLYSHVSHQQALELQQQQQEQQRKTPFNMSYWSLFLERVTAVMNRGDKKEIEFVKKMLFAASTILSMV